MKIVRKDSKIKGNPVGIKGVILAGGRATRLFPLTLVTNKHLLPLYNKPVIYYAIEKMVEFGIDKIMIVTSPEHMEDFVKLLGSGENFKPSGRGNQIQIVYGIQNKPTGIGQGLWIARDYVGSDKCLLYLGDNIIEDDLKNHVENFNDGAMVFLKKVASPKNFGVVEFNKTGEILNIKEKPKNPKSDYIATGLYLYDNTVFQKFDGMKKSERGEYEISYINNQYIKLGQMHSCFLKEEWFDTGTFEGLAEASNYMREKNKGSNKKK